MERIRRNRLGHAPSPRKTHGWEKVEGYEPWSEPLGLAFCCCAAPEKTPFDERQRIVVKVESAYFGRRFTNSSQL
jgi:hypothetical protein